MSRPHKTDSDLVKGLRPEFSHNVQSLSISNYLQSLFLSVSEPILLPICFFVFSLITTERTVQLLYHDWKGGSDQSQIARLFGRYQSM